MRKIWLVALLMLAMMLTFSACKDDSLAPMDTTARDTTATDTTVEESAVEPAETTTAAVETTVEMEGTTAEAMETTAEAAETTVEPVETTTETMETTAEAAETTVEPVETTTGTMETTAEAAETTVESVETTTETMETTAETTAQPTETTTRSLEEMTVPLDAGFRSNGYAYKPATAVYHSYDIALLGDPIATWFDYDRVYAGKHGGDGTGTYDGPQYIGHYFHRDGLLGHPSWYTVNMGAGVLSRRMDFAYAFTVDVMMHTGAEGLENSGIFIRGSEAMYTGSWANKTGDNAGFGGSGIYFNFKYDNGFGCPTHLVVVIKSDARGTGEAMTFTEHTYEIPLGEGHTDRLTIADDGERVFAMLDHELICRIDIAGSLSYDDIADGSIASTATIAFADGQTETIRGVACAASYGVLGVGGSCYDPGAQFSWTKVVVEPIEHITIPTAFVGK